MTRWYLDTSAALKLVLEEAESHALEVLVDDQRPTLAGSWLLDTEMRRAVHRHPTLSHTDVTDLLDRFDLHEMPPDLFRQAGLLPGTKLRALDALHLATAVRIGADHLVTYDRVMAEAARELGLSVLAPA